MRFSPEEILFAPTTDCNLKCPHCITQKSDATLSKRLAVKALRQCKDIGIKRVGFTGGEPFLTPDFLYALVREAVRQGMLFDRIMTNGVWYNDSASLEEILGKLYKAGYDGSICVSVDAFHRQNLRKLLLFIRTAVSIWNRTDIVSIAYVTGSRGRETAKMLRDLTVIRNPPLFIKTVKIDLSPIGKAAKFEEPWTGRWFKEDHCKGPGNVFFVLPDGSVKPCCGYATDLSALTIGNIKRDSAYSIIRKARKNRFVRTVFDSGLAAVRKRAEKIGFRFPGKTGNHCFFCHYVLTEMPKSILNKCLN